MRYAISIPMLNGAENVSAREFAVFSWSPRRTPLRRYVTNFVHLLRATLYLPVCTPRIASDVSRPRVHTDGKEKKLMRR
jgi:hypothetical protein